MNERDLLLLKLISENKTCNEICKIMKITNKQLYNKLFNLKSEGYLFNSKLYSDGKIVYKRANTVEKMEKGQKMSTSIITDHKEKNIKTLVISDLHLGNAYERLDMLDEAFNYCCKEGIHIIFCCGDLIDGTYSRVEKNIVDSKDQIDYFIKNYPFDKSILTFAVGGDHDISCLYKEGLSIMESMKRYRQDVIIGGYNNTEVFIKNDSVLLTHYISGGRLHYGSPVSLFGHYHEYKARVAPDNSLQIHVPTLSDITDTFPTALEMELNFKKGYINCVGLKHIYFENGAKTLSEMEYQILYNKHKNNLPIDNEEAYFKEDVKIRRKIR